MALVTGIQLLPDDVISQIAAGEVVERPASVVKELMENALDAGAKHIHIDISDGGRRLIRISDDGSGIPNNEVELALARHATSKLRHADDLYNIRTLGFRGEALASIVSVSRATLTTRHRDEDIGTQVRIEGGVVANQKPVGVPAGTVVAVENLFYNMPARLKFLKSENTEKRLITTIVTRYAMAYPDVRFVMVQDGREVFRSTGSGQLADVVVKVMGLDCFREMVEINDEEVVRGRGIRIGVRGFVTTPEMHRKDRTRIILFVNGRSIQDNNLTYAVTQAYHSVLVKGRYPLAVLMIDVPPDFVDVNVHPTKAEVRFQDSNAVFVGVQRIVRQTILGVMQYPRSRDDYGQHRNGHRSTWDDDDQLELDMTAYEEDPVGRFRDMPDYPPTPAETYIPEYDDQTGPSAGEGRKKRRNLPPLRVVGQVGAAYIVAEGPAGLYLIDQHAAHQRILFENLHEQYQQTQQLGGKPINPQTLDVAPRDYRLLEKHLDYLTAFGFEIEPFGTNTFMIRAVPEVTRGYDPLDLVEAIVRQLALPDTNTPSLETRLLIAIASQSAVKSGQILDLTEMRDLIERLEYAETPLKDASGNSTLIHMSAEQLSREFGRT